ncbi:MAG TPA: hypothetical protein VKP58_15290 [Candidatus Acidoferrum sp.]|nr:hypothetical protein [Candidatus Acidoferrum sp.]
MSREMFRKLRTTIACVFLLLGFLPVAICPAQEEDRAAKKSQKIDIQILVTDGKDGTPLNNVQVLVKWGEGESESQKAVTNGSGIAKLKDIPQETVTIRLVANSYRLVAPSVNLKTAKQPIKLSLDKEGSHISQ